MAVQVLHPKPMRERADAMTQRFDLRTITTLEHQLTERFGSPERFGVKLPLPPGLMTEAAKVVLTIVAADGRVSDRERSVFLGMMRSYGVSDEEIRAIGAFQPSAQMIEALVQQGAPPFLRSLVYDAIRVARVDGFHQKEREATERIVQKLGLERGLVGGIEALLRIEDAVANARNELMQTPAQLPPAWGAQRDNVGMEARGQEFGATVAVPMPREFHLAMCKTVLGIASGDRDLTETEQRWWVGFALAMGTPRDAIEEALKIDYQSVPFEQVFDGRLRPYARLAVYCALRAARADGVSDSERDMARKAARRFGLDDTFVTAIVNQIDVESAVRDARIELLAPLR